MNVTVPLDDDLSAFVASQVLMGRYSSSGQVVADALRLLRSLEATAAYSTDELRAAWQEGEDSGDAGEINFEKLKEEARGAG